jgi:hypothetical protein
MVGFAAGRFAPREAYSLRSYRGWLLCREALHHASMISHRGQDYWLVRQGMKKPRERGCRGFLAIGDGGERLVLDQEALSTSSTSSISTIICLMS